LVPHDRAGTRLDINQGARVDYRKYRQAAIYDDYCMFSVYQLTWGGRFHTNG